MPLDIYTSGATREERSHLDFRACASDVREGEGASAARRRLGRIPRAPALILHVYSLHCAALLLAKAQELVIREIQSKSEKKEGWRRTGFSCLCALHKRR